MFKRSFQCIMRAERSARVFRRRNKPRYTQIAIIRRFCRKLSDISLPLEILRRLNARFTALFVQNVVHAFSIVETRPETRKSQSFADFKKIKRYFFPVCDISTFKRYFHSILHAKRCVRVFQRRNKPTHKQIAIIRRF